VGWLRLSCQRTACPPGRFFWGASIYVCWEVSVPQCSPDQAAHQPLRDGYNVLIIYRHLSVLVGLGRTSNGKSKGNCGLITNYELLAKALLRRLVASPPKTMPCDHFDCSFIDQSRYADGYEERAYYRSDLCEIIHGRALKPILLLPGITIKRCILGAKFDL
jgi:hypothetical protein